jgi:antirestriction protein ArdC
MVGQPRRKYTVQCRKQSALFWMQRRSVVDGASGRLSHAALFDVQAGLGVGRHRKGERGTKVYFVKQLQVRDQSADDNSSTRLVQMMRQYTVSMSTSVKIFPTAPTRGKPIRVRNPDTRDELADAFLGSTGADVREGHGEACYVPSRDFISMPAFAGFKGADHFYNVAFHELTHNADLRIMPNRYHRHVPARGERRRRSA